MQLKTKAHVLRKLNNIADAKFKQGFLLKDLCHSLEVHYKNKPFKEWFILMQGLLKDLDIKE